jgi:chitin disaccharide deacetylase
VRRLVVNADDFGRSKGVNEGVLRAYDDGIVTSASLMVRWPAATEAAEAARDRPELGVGVHVDLGEWVFENGGWETVYRVCGDTHAEVEREVALQLDRFQELVGRPPTHLDSHQHVHLHEPVRSILQRYADEWGVPLRQLTPGVVHRGEFYGQTATGEPYPEGIAPARLVGLIGEVGEGVVTEIACHPGTREAQTWSVYADEREQELAALCDPAVVAAVTETGVVCGPFA